MPALTSSAPALSIRRGRVALSLLWFTQIAVAGMFFFAGGLKLSSAPEMVAVFDLLGGQWFRYLTGVIEVGAALALLIPPVAVFGALLLVPTMIGAIATHLFVVGGSAAAPVVLLAAVTGIVWVRRDELVSAFARVHSE